jgi:multiple sugar transport system ATP-binding protein
MVTRLEDLTSGSIAIGDQGVDQLPSKRRNIAVVFQNYALYLHMTVAGNIGYGERADPRSRHRYGKPRACWA